MRDQHDGRAGLAPDAKEFVAHQQPRLLIERRERLVEQQYGRLHDQRACDADALAHAAGQLRRIGISKTRQSHELKRVIDSLGDSRRSKALSAQAEGDIVPHGEPGEARILLKHDADAVRHRALDLGAVADNRAARRRREARQNIEQGRLAAARRPNHREELAALDIEVDRAERVDRAALAHAWEYLGYPARFDMDAGISHGRAACVREQEASR